MEVEAEVRVDGFENFPKEELGTYDLVTTNVPFGDFAVYDPDYSNSKDPERRAAAKYIHRYYVLKGLDCLRDGGIEAYIITSNYLNHDSVQIAKALKESRLVGAYRLANNLFKENGTEVGTDLLVLQKDSAKENFTTDETFLITPYTTAVPDEPVFRHAPRPYHRYQYRDWYGCLRQARIRLSSRGRRGGYQ